MSTAVDCLFADAYAFIEQGVCHDEVNDWDNARKMYERGMEISSEALGMNEADASSFRDGIIRLRRLVEERIKDLSHKIHIDPMKLSEMRSQLESTGDSISSDGELYYWLPDGVQLVVIEGDKTNAPSPPSSLAIFKFAKHSGENKQPMPAALIQVGPWCYPLTSDTSILKNQLGVYVVPNPTKDHPNMFVGIILPRGIEPRLEDEFVYALKQFSVLKSSDIVEKMAPEQRQRTSERIAEFLIKSGEYLAVNTQNFANKTGKYMAERGESYRANMETTNQPVNINPAIRHGVFVLHRGSKVVAKVTRYVLDKIGDVGIAVGQKVADSLSSESSTSGRAFKSTATVVGGGITAISTVWMSLEEASKTLMRSFANETVQTVHIRYGDDASQTAHHALHAVGHTTLAGFQLYEFGPRSIAGRMARKAGLQFVQGISKTSANSMDGEDVNTLKTVRKT